MTLNTVTLKWDLTDLIESGVAATLTITPTAQLSDATDHVLIPAVARSVTFPFGTGQLAGIVANDNSSVLPTGTGYLISVADANGRVIVPQFQTQLNFSGGATQWLDALAPVASVTTAYQYLPLPSGTPSANQVPVATGSGQASAWGTPPGSTPSGAAGGDLSGTYPSPGVAKSGGVAFGSAAFQPASAFDAAGTAATVQGLALLRANNLSDLASATTALLNLGIKLPAASAGFAPSSPSSTTSQTQVMMGLGNSPGQATPVQYTPAGSGKVIITVTGTAQTATAAANVTVGGRWGTGNGPANAASVTGTQFGPAADAQVHGTGASPTGFAITARLSLTAGTQYWFDLAVATATSADAASVSNIAVTIAEQLS